MGDEMRNTKPISLTRVTVIETKRATDCSHKACTLAPSDTFMGLPVCWLHRLTSVVHSRLS